MYAEEDLDMDMAMYVLLREGGAKVWYDTEPVGYGELAEAITIIYRNMLTPKNEWGGVGN